MRGMDSNSVDSIITDPPYALTANKKGGAGDASVNLSSPYGRARITTGFMNKSWDGNLPPVEVWKECLRVAKPGAMLVAFGGTRTYHRLTCAIEDAGWEIRDCIMWVYGSGFPKSLDIGKAIDKLQGNERQSIGQYIAPDGGVRKLENHKPHKLASVADHQYGYKTSGFIPITKGNSQWEGYGTALKPAYEPIVLAMKPLDGTFAENALKWKVAGINVDGCRVPATGERLGGGDENGVSHLSASGDGWDRPWRHNDDAVASHNAKIKANVDKATQMGRFPANFIHDGSDEVLQLFPMTTSGAMKKPYVYTNTGTSFGKPTGATKQIHDANSGSAARFFYTAKASRSERGEGNNHPTVKPLKLVEYLCKLTMPPDAGTVLDPFMGSGTTGIACRNLGRNFIGIEKEPEYFDIATKRIEFETRQQKLWAN